MDNHTSAWVQIVQHTHISSFSYRLCPEHIQYSPSISSLSHVTDLKDKARTIKTAGHHATRAPLGALGVMGDCLFSIF